MPALRRKRSSAAALTNAFDPQMKTCFGDVGKRARTSATIGPSTGDGRVGLAPRCLPCDSQYKPESVFAALQIDEFVPVETSFNRRAESSRMAGTCAAVASLCRIIDISGTTPEPPPISSSGPPSDPVQIKCPPSGPLSFDLVADRDNLVEERRDLAVV